MKKIVTIILLGSAFLLPNNNVEASYSSEGQEVHYIKQVYDYNHLIERENSPKYKRFYIHKYWTNKVNDKQATWQGPNDEEKTWTEREPVQEESKKEDLTEIPKETETEESKERPKKEEDETVEQVIPTEPNPEQEAPSTNEQEEVEDNSSILSAFEQEVFNLTNVERTKAGLQPLQIDEQLTKSAQEKSTDMAVNRYFSHTSPTYGSPFDQMKRHGVTYRAAAENIASGQQSAEEVVRAWMNSPGHRQNILTPTFTHIGIGHATNGNYWTQQFIQK